MEEHCDYPEVLNWTYSDLKANQEDTSYPPCNGASPCLPLYVLKKFETLMCPCGMADGFAESFSYDLINRITTNSKCKCIQNWLEMSFMAMSGQI